MMQFHRHTSTVALTVIGSCVAASIALLNGAEIEIIAAVGLSVLVVMNLVVHPVFWMVVTTVGSLTSCIATIVYLVTFEFLTALGCLVLTLACSAGFLVACRARIAKDYGYGPYE